MSDSSENFWTSLPNRRYKGNNSLWLFITSIWKIKKTVEKFVQCWNCELIVRKLKEHSLSAIQINGRAETIKGYLFLFKLNTYYISKLMWNENCIREVTLTLLSTSWSIKSMMSSESQLWTSFKQAVKQNKKMSGYWNSF